MGELLDYFKEKYMKSDSGNTKDLMRKQKVKNEILRICDKLIESSDEVLTFEILPQDLPYVAEILDEEPLKSKYQIIQISDTLFSAKLVEMEF
mgnify:CR=1 FL=1